MPNRSGKSPNAVLHRERPGSHSALDLCERLPRLTTLREDCGANFQSQLLQEVCEILEIRKTRTTLYHPEGNGLVERTNRTLHDLLLAFSRDGHEHDWDAHLPLCLLVYRGGVHSSTVFTPRYLWTGRDLHLPADLRYPLPTPDPPTLHEYVTHLRGVIRSAHNAARVALGAATQHQKEQFDRHTAGTPHQVGDLVMHYNPVPPRGTSAKLHHPWQGPFTILDVLAPTTFLLRDAVHPDYPSFTTHFSKLKPYRGRLPICTPGSLPVIPLDLVPPVAIEVTVPSPIDCTSTEDSAAPEEGGIVTTDCFKRTFLLPAPPFSEFG
ncbi:hypothetical protein SprV_0702363900 [Sparganum proliferum]